MNNFYEGIELDKKRVMYVIGFKIISFLIFYLFIYLISIKIEKNGVVLKIEELTRKDLTILAIYFSMCAIIYLFQFVLYSLISYIPSRLKIGSFGYKVLFVLGFFSFIFSFIFLFMINKRLKNFLKQKYDEKRKI